MKLYKYDLHVHTSSVSPCAHVAAEEVVKLYQQAGYQGVVITDHFCEQFFESLPASSWRDKVRQYLAGYLAAREAGEKLGVDVLHGIEIRLAGSANEYLVYGVTEEFLLAHPQLYNLQLAELYQLTKANGMLLYQAHPFRPYIERADPKLLDGVEVFNGNPRHQSQNHLALAFADTHGLLKISGSDFHQVVDLGIGGVVLRDRAASSQDLVEILAADQIEQLITNPLPEV